LTFGEDKESALAEVQDACKKAGYPEATIDNLTIRKLLIQDWFTPLKKIILLWLHLRIQYMFKRHPMPILKP
jgi:hypothetical protein